MPGFRAALWKTRLALSGQGGGTDGGSTRHTEQRGSTQLGNSGQAAARKYKCVVNNSLIVITY